MLAYRTRNMVTATAWAMAAGVCGMACSCRYHQERPGRTLSLGTCSAEPQCCPFAPRELCTSAHSTSIPKRQVMPNAEEESKLLFQAYKKISEVTSSIVLAHNSGEAREFCTDIPCVLVTVQLL